jgi:predicted DNA-binding transcriptional regulator AlpA
MKNLIKTSDLCNMLGVTRQCVYKWRNFDHDPMPVAIDNTKKQISSGRGKTIRFNLDDVIEWLNSNGKEDKATKVLHKKED